MSREQAIRTHVTFKTERFNMTEVGEHFINECCFGETVLPGSLASSAGAAGPRSKTPGRRIGGGRRAASGTPGASS